MGTGTSLSPTTTARPNGATLLRASCHQLHRHIHAASLGEGAHGSGACVGTKATHIEWHRPQTLRQRQLGGIAVGGNDPRRPQLLRDLDG
jgi:hypothetical protein